MKLFHFFLIIILLINCSFDNKTGIWKNENLKKNNENNLYKDFKKISSSNKVFNEIIFLKKQFNFTSTEPISNINWKDYFYSSSNNTINFKYNNKNQLIFKSKKITKFEPSNFKLYENNNIIINDNKGNIIVYSIKNKKIISKFNFYKKRYKKIKKKLNLIVEKNVIYVSDNIGYLYAYDYIKKKIIWAKNYNVPFKSNLKIFKNNLIAANQKNTIYFFNKNNGKILKLIPTEETIVTNQFINNFSIEDNSLFFLNSFGSLYSIDIKSKRINWFNNLNQSLELTSNNLFFSKQIVNYKNRIVISTDLNTYFIDANSGNIISRKNFTSNFKPIIYKDHVFCLTKNNLLIALNYKTAEILYSYNLNVQIDKMFKKRKKNKFQNFMLANNKFLVFDKSLISFFNLKGQLEQINKLPSKIKTRPIFINGSIIFLDNNNKLKILD